ncbi:PIN-like domain-containing protein [Kribbella sp. NPDC023855]|uniref:PIN-like domain-containing protein n=1 Tax=Kribbella sp. NPDC023855 TaxID=3154698 RepID=UPI0033D7A36B
MYDGFEGYRLSSSEEIGKALQTGLVTLDANALLNLYRYNAGTRDDLFQILERLGDRLVVPHQALKEFWRNRITAMGNPSTAIKDVRSAFEKNCRSTESAVLTWAKHVALEDERRNELLGMVKRLYDDLTDAVTVGGPGDIAIGASSSDGILIRLERLLDGSVTPELDKETWDICVAEGQRRVEAGEPPGYLDAVKDESSLPEGSAGDYLVWFQACQAAKARRLDLVLVTGDEKEDWWWRHHSEFFGPRPELSAELLSLTGQRLFMLRPKDLLAHSQALAVTVRRESVEDAERPRPEYEVTWTASGVNELLRRLDAQGPVQAEVIRLAAQSGGRVERQAVYELGDIDDKTTLNGFTKPVRRLTADLQREGIVADGVPTALVPLYRSGGKASSFRVPSEIVHILQGTDDQELDAE